MIDALLLIAGLVVLIKGADFLVDGAAAISAHFGVSALVIGLTVVSFGTSLPELLVALVSGLRGNADLAVASVIGSNIANALLVLGVAAIIRPLPVKNTTVVSEIPFLLTAAFAVGFLANAALLSNYPELSISRLDGGILLSMFLLFMLYVAMTFRTIDQPGTETRNTKPLVRAITLVALGVTGLYFGGIWSVDGAVGLAQRLGTDEHIIGLTIVAIGTSAPELMASAVAAYKNQTDIAVGNVVGSNIFNLLWVLGFTSSVVELPFKLVNNTDLLMVIASSVMILAALVTSRNRTLSRPHGIVFLSLYVFYLVYILHRS